MRRCLTFLALLVLVAGLTGCLGLDEAPEDASPASANRTNDSEETQDDRVESRSIDEGNGTGDNATQEATGDATNETPGSASVPALAFREPIRLNGEGYGFEPSIAAGPDGTLYATAARGFHEDPPEQRASWLWSSTDEGSTWKELPSPQQVHEKQPAAEGDIAVDDEGRLYFVDTYLADNTLSRWSLTEEGPSWDFSRPVQGTAGVDDRPWLAAHGDGVVYYLGNNGPALPAPNNAQEGDPTSRMWLYTSEDGGETFSLSHGFAKSWWCGLDASPADSETVAVMCSRIQGTYTFGYHGLIEGYESVVYVSEDRGQTWTETVLKEHEDDPAAGFPALAFGQAGTPYATWAEGTGPTELYVARPSQGTWEVFETTPFEGTLENAWVGAGSNGTVAITFYATEDAEPDEDTTWHAYAMVTDDAQAAQPSWQLTRLSEEPVAEGPHAPYDFFQNTVDASGVVNVVFTRDTEDPQRVLFTRQTSGVNLAP